MALPSGRRKILPLADVPSSRREQAGPAVTRLAAAAGVALLHLGAYLLVTRVNAARPESQLWELALPVDAVIPHLAGTWPLYWIVYPFVPLGGWLAISRMARPAYRRALAAYVAIIFVGACVQLLVPARAPWPVDAAPMQRAYHESGLVLPYANLPSMHVAFATLTAALLTSALPGRVARSAAVAAAICITAGTLTLKEHFVLDAVTGCLLGLAAWRWWLRGAARRAPSA